MNYFIVGDIHGCYYTLCQLLGHWDRANEVLIFVGDLIDRGKHSAKVLQLCKALSDGDNQVVVLKGNHEAELIQYVLEGSNNNWTDQGGDLTLLNFEQEKLLIQEYVSWLQALPLYFETPYFSVTHAGITATANPFLEEHEDSVLWNRKPLQNIGKLQVHGHTPLLAFSAQYTPESNAWNIDTGAFYGYGLTGIKIANKSQMGTPLSVPTDPLDQ
ncbi:metallophosphoesterase [Myroides sp. DW712]|uniref:metallophosphoesterase n=1 Tax=Myroides sp. DW712 TaxID=3389800 RepID=UPI00397E376B